jgi:hypothetical protein
MLAIFTYLQPTRSSIAARDDSDSSFLRKQCSGIPTCSWNLNQQSQCQGSFNEYCLSPIFLFFCNKFCLSKVLAKIIILLFCTVLVGT